MDGVELPEIVCINLTFFIIFPISQRKPPDPPLVYGLKADYVANFFKDPDNKDCKDDFKAKGVDYDRFIKTALDAKYLDFYNNNGFWSGHPFQEMPASPKLPGAGVPNTVLGAKVAITFVFQNTVTVGSLFESRTDKNLTIVHEIFHLYYQTPLHVPIANKLKLGSFKDGEEGAAEKALDSWLGSDCGHKK